MTAKKLKELRRLYQKWVVQRADAVYYGSVSDASSDFELLFQILNLKMK